MNVLEAKETIHIYYEREQEKRPYAAFPLFCAFVCLVGIVAITVYSWEHPSYEQAKITSSAHFFMRSFSAESTIIPTGVKTYPATYAHGFLAFSNGSVIGQSIPAGFTIDGAMTDRATYVPPATANGFGMATVPAHLVVAGINKPTLAINEVIGSSLFIRNLSPFFGGHPAYSVRFVTEQDKVTAMSKARALVGAKKSQVLAFPTRPCQENLLGARSTVIVSWICQFATYKVPSYMHVIAAHLSGNSFFVDVVFVARPRPVRIR